MDLEYLRNRTKVVHPNLLRIQQIKSLYDEDDLIPTTTISIYFEPFKKSLGDELRERISSANKLSELELMLQLKNCIDVLALLQEKGFVHGHISAETIFYGNDNQIKIADSTLVGSLFLHDLMKMEMNQLGSLTAPENADPRSRIGKSVFKNDVFSLGMTFLSLALLEDISACYRSDYTFDYPKLIQFFDRFQMGNKKNLGNVLKFMLIGDEADRPDMISL